MNCILPYQRDTVLSDNLYFFLSFSLLHRNVPKIYMYDIHVYYKVVRPKTKSFHFTSALINDA